MSRCAHGRLAFAVPLLAASTFGCGGATASPPAQPHTGVADAAAAIVTAGAPVLRERAAEVSPEEFGGEALRALSERMIAAMRAAPGVGLAAPQIGVGLRVFVVEDRAEYHAKLSEAERVERERVPVEVKVFVNPTLTPVGEARRTFFEGCLSVPGYTALVERAHEVELRGFDLDGKPVQWRVQGWPARILQHEFDHLDGTLYVDRMHSRSLMTGEHAKARFGGKPIAEILHAFAARP